ncbi:hypothetical protein RFI_39764 [Reticulomyxa filosa]|uniref:Sulfotransferase n=1 Tax=Reticulomyxa filosa TaxID=46433 RepID=X6L9F2_RETFI|nr:hypothetical protein RFI_39764 [Reticulomyxa filosa]|eukprot:ETN97761.1 hypothetical protein RFI_39764 [Reticulomyxa filosa]
MGKKKPKHTPKNPERFRQTKKFFDPSVVILSIKKKKKHKRKQQKKNTKKKKEKEIRKLLKKKSKHFQKPNEQERTSFLGDIENKSADNASNDCATWDPNFFRPLNWEEFLTSGKLFTDQTYQLVNEVVKDTKLSTPPVFVGTTFFLEEKKQESDCLKDKIRYTYTYTYIFGCGRSGTTLVGQILACCEDVLFLNEPRSLWLTVCPELDVWSLAVSFSKKKKKKKFTNRNRNRNRNANI